MIKPYPLILQQDQSDCGVACLLTITKYYGGFNTFENVRRLSGTHISGTTLLGLYQAAMQMGFTAEGCEADIEALINHNQPCVLHLTLQDSLQHYVVYYGVNQKDNTLIIGDPAKGIVHFSKEHLNNIWQSKTCLTLTPNHTFITKIEIKKKKIEWIKNLLKEDKSLLIIAVVLGVFMATLGLAMAIFSQSLIDEILPNKNFAKLNIGIILVFMLMIAKESLSVLRQHLLLRQTKSFNSRIIDFFFNHLLQLPKSFFDTRKIGELTARLNDTSRIQKVITQLAGNVVIDILMIIVSISVVFTYSITIGFLCIATIPVFYLLIYKHNNNIMTGQRAIMSSYANTEANYISSLQGIEPIKNHNKQAYYASTNNTIYKIYQHAIYELGAIQIRVSYFANSFGILFLIGILFYGSHQVLGNHLKVGELIAVLSLCGSVLPSVANLALITLPINEAKIAFDRMFEFTAIDPENITNTKTIDQLNSLQVQNLSFRYAGKSQLLKKLSFKVKKGEIIALMGENGCGKSTLIQIIQKHYNQESGNIIINQNIQLQNISFTNWRNICAVVPQNIHVFNGSILENIAFENATTQTEQVINFLNENGFTPFIESLPQSFFTFVGDEGINLSGGQKQMIAIARALYTNPQLLILDEATAAMDRESEQFILSLLLKIKKDIAIIFITHRLHVLKSFCDNIYVLEKGVVSTEGNHVVLLQSNNLYSRYWSDLVS
jgi:ABC-type bacteriocin/lantibiotic exporter with double-glycine peptidase domain